MLRVHQRRRSRWPAATRVEGFELHQGITEADSSLQPLLEDNALGWWRPGPQGGAIVGSYLHGLLDNGPWRRHWLNQLRMRRGLAALDVDRPHHGNHRDLLLDRLANAFEQHVNLDPLLRP